MGWTVLYIAFGIVALWLLGEVLLQYKARLRWRLLAFVGFLGVVLGVLISQVLVIGLGAAAFAVGQTYVTLSFRSGFSAGWAVAGRSGFLARFGKGKGRGEGEYKDPTLEVSGLEAREGAYGPGNGADAGFDGNSAAGVGNDAYDTGAGTYRQGDDFDRDYDRDDVFTPARSARPAGAESGAVYEPQPLPDDTGSYGIYSDAAYAAATGQDQPYAAAQSGDQTYGYDGYTGYDQQQYGYDASGQQQYAAYSDPYIGQGYGGNSYDAGYDQQQYGQQGYGQDQYGQQGYGETPASGVWVPQQRNTDDPFSGGELPPEQQYPYQDNGQGTGHGQDSGNDNGQTNGHGYDEQQYRF
ncbi:hypothetical protein GCM10023084_65870 [Streptomyces lacrimifluminis]|uniref:Uncharacterized protein n=1 Tax=Streptomyces lacrimifluminis TaxID=1500077 RepID=A0A917LD14_9ACTN|nr:hypothetical protein [Streptomyces lacrimifluminis]GGJ59791.1 hypothetical protein GCM10012282_66350 [Streptomyces lacrimifluminis]